MLYGKREGDPNFKTNLRYPVERVVEWSRAQLEAHMTFACMFNQSEVVWFDYRPIRLDKLDEHLVFEVTGRNYVPLPEAGSYEQIKDALL